MAPLGSKAPAFRLPDTSGKLVSLDDLRAAPALLVMFLCNHCPFVKHVRSGIVELAAAYQKRGVAVVAISSNDAVTFPDNGPAKMAEDARTYGYSFPYLYDETQQVAKAYRAACTPEFYVYDRERKLAYRGQLDDSRPENGIPVTGRDLRAALDAVLAAKPVPADQKPSVGCNIKWKASNEPDYAR